MQYILVDALERQHFYPFTLTQSLASCRVGIFTFQQRWEQYTEKTCGVYTADYLQNLYEDNDWINSKDVLTFINITCIPSTHLMAAIHSLQEDEQLRTSQGKWIAIKTKQRDIQKLLTGNNKPIIFDAVDFISNSLELLSSQKVLIERDFKWVSSQRKSQPIDPSNNCINENQIFIEKGATVLCSNLNASEGYIYIGNESIIMEGVSIRGSFVLGEKAVVKMNTSIYGNTTIGPYCLAGGEIKNSILMGYSNKGHEGYLGDSIIGHWCNLGAGTSNSNIKNTAGLIQMWNENTQNWEQVGQKMGMIMGDYSRFAIQSSINSGTYVGVSAHIFASGLLPKYIPNFTWGLDTDYALDKAIKHIENWKKLKGFTFNEAEIQVLKHLYSLNRS